MTLTKRTIALLNTAASLAFANLALNTLDSPQFFGVISVGFGMVAIACFVEYVGEIKLRRFK